MRETAMERGIETAAAAAIGFSLMLIERVTAVGDSQSVWSRVSTVDSRESMRRLPMDALDADEDTLL